SGGRPLRAANPRAQQPAKPSACLFAVLIPAVAVTQTRPAHDPETAPEPRASGPCSSNPCLLKECSPDTTVLPCMRRPQTSPSRRHAPHSLPASSTKAAGLRQALLRSLDQKSATA